MSVLSRPIVFTADLPGWRRLLAALGAVPLERAPGWEVYAFGSGRVALHDAEHAPHDPGFVLLGFEVPDLAAWTAGEGSSVEHVLEEADHGTAARVTAADGVWFRVDQRTPTDDEATATLRRDGAPDPGIAVLPLWYTDDVAGAGGVIEAVGATPRIRGDNGVWADFIAPAGGLVAVHEASTVGTVLSFECQDDIAALHQRLLDADVDAALVDETYARVLRLPNPDGGEDIWVNEAQQDMYGFSRVEP